MQKASPIKTTSLTEDKAYLLLFVRNAFSLAKIGKI
jgi:hypothetical protein